MLRRSEMPNANVAGTSKTRLFASRMKRFCWQTGRTEQAASEMSGARRRGPRPPAVLAITPSRVLTGALIGAAACPFRGLVPLPSRLGPLFGVVLGFSACTLRTGFAVFPLGLCHLMSPSVERPRAMRRPPFQPVKTRRVPAPPSRGRNPPGYAGVQVGISVGGVASKIERAMPGQFNARAIYTPSPAGLECRVTLSTAVDRSGG